MPTSKKTIQGFSPRTSQAPGLMQIIAMKSTLHCRTKHSQQLLKYTLLALFCTGDDNGGVGKLDMPDASTALCRSHAWTPQFTSDSGTAVTCGRPHTAALPRGGPTCPAESQPWGRQTASGSKQGASDKEPDH